jgi:acyl-CoA synthetase (AMP-forming)/AMP-acid ligase II
MARRLASYLINDLGVQKEEKMAILSESKPEFGVCVLASVISGMITVPLDIKLTIYELTSILTDCMPSVMLVSLSYLDKALELQKEISSLNEFVLMYKKDILDALSPNHKHSFTTHGFFLKNANICINYQHNKICEINNNYSLEKNIKNIIEKNIDKNISHINILTSLKEISTTESLENNDGIALIFENRTEVLLPHELKQLSQTDNPFYIIKNKMGINPDYTSSKMKYFKFKTLEIEINDNI